MNQTIFSVIITAYNQPDEIKRAVDSVLNQSEKSFEIIVVDDCSTDQTPQILDEYAKNNSNFKVIHHKKNGSSHTARCSGVEKAKGRFVIFLDGDDYIVPDALEKLKNEVVDKENNFDVCEYSYQCQPSGEAYKPVVYDKSRPIIDFYLNHDSPVTVWNKLYRTEIVKKAFENMQKAYIRCGDDTYETICIAYYTKKYIQKDILVTNYQLDIGVSKRKNNFESNLRHCESFTTALKCLKDFLDASDYQYKDEMYSMIEQKFFDWMSAVMQNNTVEEDIVKSLLLLPRYFSLQVIEPDFKRLYSVLIKYKRFKALVKKCLFWFKK